MRNLLLALIGTTLLSGCIISHRDSDEESWRSGDPGDIEFRWDFAGDTCATANPPVYKVQVRVQGRWGEELLRDGGLYDCRTGGVDGIRLLNFSGGNYNFTLDALDAYDRVLYTTSGTVFVDGTVVVRATLNPTQTIGRVNVYWKFGPAQRSCADAAIYVPQGQSSAPGVTSVVAKLDTENGVTLDCAQRGFSRDLSPGTHLLTLEGYIPDPATGAEQLWYKVTRTLIVQQGANADVTIVLDPVATVGTVKPVLKNAQGATVDCVAAGVNKLAIQLTDWANVPYYTQPFEGACSDWLVKGFKFTWLPVQFSPAAWSETEECYLGTYTVRVEGRYCPNSTCAVMNEGVVQSAFRGGMADQLVTVELPPKSN